MNAQPSAFSVETFGYDYASQPKEMLSECPLCGCGGFVEVAVRDRYGFENPTHVCAQCGLAFLNPRMTREAYSEFYAHTYRKLSAAVHGREHDEERHKEAQRRYARRLGDFLHGALGFDVASPGSILDLGGGNGEVVRALCERWQAEATVVDPSSEVLYADGCDKHKSFVEDWKPNQRYGLVIVCQTFDHVLNPRAALEVARTAMEDTGILFIDIVDWLADGTQNRNIRSGIKIDHPFGWTEGVMKAALLAHGFSIVRMRYESNGRHIGYACRKVPLGQGNYYQHGPSVLARCREVMLR